MAEDSFGKKLSHGRGRCYGRHTVRSLCAVISLCALLVLPFILGGADGEGESSTQVELFSASPIAFIKNVGQIKDESVRYAFYGRGANVFYTDAGPIFELFKESESMSFSVGFAGARDVVPVGTEAQQTKVNYFIGSDTEAWRRDVPTYAKVVYPQLYEGIDLHTYGKRSHIKYEFHLAAGIDYEQIRIEYRNVEKIYIGNSGALHVVTSLGEVVDKAPYIYQVVGEKQIPVAGRYKLIDAKTCGFEITGEIDPNAELVIDPELIWADFLGGSDYDSGLGMAVNSAGNMIVTGETRNTSDFVGADNENNGKVDAFVGCVDPDGVLLWATYIGGSGNDYGFDAAVDRQDNIVITGMTMSSNFPGARNQHSINTEPDAFAARLTPDGVLEWSYYLGGDRTDRGYGIAVDRTGDVYVAGYTRSMNFNQEQGTRILNSFQGGTFDGFTVKISYDGIFQWMRYMAGALSGNCEGICVDDDGNSYVTGFTYAGLLEGAVNMRYSGDDAFIICCDPSGQIRWSRYFGGKDTDIGYGVTLDRNDNVVLTGYTRSVGFDGANNSSYGQGDAFVASADPNGVLLFASYVGGSGTDSANDVIVDRSGNIIVTGYTSSKDFAAADNKYKAGPDAFVAAVTDKGTLLISSYLGGSYDDLAQAVALDSSNNILVAGSTSSPDFVGADSSYKGGSRDVFIAKLRAVADLYPDLIVSYSTEQVEVIAGETAVIEIELENAGDSDAYPTGPGYFSTVIYFSDAEDAEWEEVTEKLGEFELSLLDAGDTLLEGIEFVAPQIPGTYYARARVDDFDSVLEDYEHNNWGRVIKIIVHEVPGEPDLVIADPAQDMVTVEMGKTVDIEVIVENAGDLQAVSETTEYFETLLYFSNDPNVDWGGLTSNYEPIEIGFLDIAQRRTERITIAAPDIPGDYYVRAFADVGNVVSESDEENNWGRIVTVRVVEPEPLPDLRILDNAPEPLLYAPGETINIFIDIQNSGDANAIAPEGGVITVGVYIANHGGINWDSLGSALGEITISSVGAHEVLFREEVQIKLPREAGDYRLRAKVDSTSVITESDETNNWGPVISLLVDADYIYPDLIAVFEDVNDISARPGQTVEVPVQILNRGNDNAIPQGVNYFDTLLYIATSPTVDWNTLFSQIDPVRENFLDPNEIVTGSFVFTAPMEVGTYYLRARADVFDSVVENNEDNWSAGITVIVAGLPITNEPPVLGVIGDRTIAEMQLLEIQLTAHDPDEDELVFSVESLPRRASFDSSTNTFLFQPDYDQAGIYDVTFNVTDTEFVDSETITITVTNTNRRPGIDPINDWNINEKETVDITVTASDPDGDEVSLSVLNFPSGATFVGGVFQWTPDYTQAGDYVVTFVADDGNAQNNEGLESVNITVNNVNRPPDANAGPDQTVNDLDSSGGEVVVLDGSGSADPDGDIASYRWTDDLGDNIPAVVNPQALLRVGLHTITLTVTDADGAIDTDTVVVTVSSTANRTPVADAGFDQTVIDTDGDGSEQVILNGSGSYDPDGSIRTYMWTENTQLIGVGVNPAVNLAVGSHTIELTVIDTAFAMDSDTVTITVNPSTNRSPVADAGDDIIVTDVDDSGSEQVILDGSASYDPDGTVVLYEWIENAQTIAVGSSPQVNLAVGSHTITLRVTDNDSTTNSDTVIVTVNPPGGGDLPPVLAAIEDPNAMENTLLSFAVTAADPEQYTIVYSADPLPPGARFNPSTGQFQWRPWHDQAGTYEVTFTATANGLSDSQTVTITVENSNMAPWYRHWLQSQDLLPVQQSGEKLIDEIGDKAASENAVLTFVITAENPDGIVYSAQNLPAGAVLEGNTFTWRPRYSQAGQHEVTFTATLDQQQTTEAITITVEDAPISAWYQRWLESVGQY